MKILLCIPFLDEGGGAERQLSYLATELLRRGYEVHIAYTQGGALVAPLANAGVVLHDVGGRGNYDPRIVIRLIRVILAIRPDVVQTNLPQMDVLAGIAALVTGKRWILQERSVASSYARGWKSRLRHLLGRAASTIVSNSSEGDAYWSVAKNRYVIGPGIPSIPDAQSHRSNVVLFAGRLNEGKNVGTFLDAVALLDVDFSAVICGEGPLRGELERKTGPRVTFTGVVSDLPERMQRAAVVVSLSRFEGCPNVVMEAMACGTPLVVSDIPAHRALLGDDAALFVGADDAAAAAAAIRSTLDDRDAAHERARIARLRASRRSIAAMADEYESLYRSRVTRYEESMASQVAELFHRQYGTPRETFLDRFARFYEHPYQRGRCFRVVALEGDRVAGFAGFVVWPYELDGRQFRSFQCCDVLVDPRHRGRGTFQRMLDFANEQPGIDFLLGFPVKAAEKAFLRNGWKHVLDLQWYVKLVNPFAKPVNQAPPTRHESPSRLRLTDRPDFIAWRRGYSHANRYLTHGPFELKQIRRGGVLRELTIGDVRAEDADFSVLANEFRGVTYLSIALNPLDSLVTRVMSAGFRKIDRTISFVVKPFSAGDLVLDPARWRLFRSDIDTW
ncbi:MAG TPA: GNAT family N-acetyltransferase [Thermoanaerobaculia bacterium]|jgi:glycosyltransferase involved in cell wall biosynthesis|nr:GNAT family N-acetyltransferase [Thermoanaerobaculia bacterium]